MKQISNFNREELFWEKLFLIEFFENFQEFDFDSLLGRVKSSSYCPAEDSEDFRQLSADLSVLFDDSNVDGKIKFEYHTDLYLGNAKQWK